MLKSCIELIFSDYLLFLQKRYVIVRKNGFICEIFKIRDEYRFDMRSLKEQKRLYKNKGSSIWNFLLETLNENEYDQDRKNIF